MAWPFAGHTQQLNNYRIGYLGVGSAAGTFSPRQAGWSMSALPPNLLQNYFRPWREEQFSKSSLE
jgi:hypothetical protein